MAAFWDIVGMAANLLQLFGGLDAITLVTVATGFLRFHEMDKECRKLEERVRTLRLLLRLSPAGSWIMAQQQQLLQQQNLEPGHLVAGAIKDADDLVESYNGSTLFARLRRGRSMARRLRDLRSTIDCYCGIILAVNAFLLAVPTNPPPPWFISRTTQVNDASVPPSARDSIDAEAPTALRASDDDTHHIIDMSQE